MQELNATGMTVDIQEGQLLWAPSEARQQATPLYHYQQWLKETHGHQFDSYTNLWHWSVTEVEAFWESLWQYFDIQSSAPYHCVLESRTMPEARWFPGARLNYAEHVLRNATPSRDALQYLSESQSLRRMSWQQLSQQVRILASWMRQQGIVPGDRIVAYLPNTPDTLVAMLATTAIGAIWSSCSPDFGTNGVLDRVRQLQPRLILATTGYRYGGKHYDRREQLATICDALPSLEQLVVVPEEQIARPVSLQHSYVCISDWQEIMAGQDPGPESFQFEQVTFDHPLWILFSSGTTGLPKAIMHGHGGILLEQLKVQQFHMDYRAGDVVFFYSTTGWMMWNSLVSSLLSDTCPVLYDGNPSYPDVDVLWRMVEQSKVAFFGSSPSFVEIMRKQGIVPKQRYDLSSLRTVMPAGSIVTPECCAWFYQNVKDDLWIATGSGGTDVCSGLVGGVPTQPVYAGEIQAPSLGVAAQAFNDHGEPMINEVGELVITQPLPSMPVGFWGDDNFERYRDSYFDQFPGVWRHGDFFRINERGGCFIHGRSDATLNRYGIRIGTAEVYRALDTIDGILDSLVVNLDLPGGTFFMPLFITLKPDHALDDSLRQRIVATLKEKCTPRHVPDAMYQVEQIPVTLTGKRMEVPVRKILMGKEVAQAANLSAMKDPSALDFFVEYARTNNDYSL